MGDDGNPVGGGPVLALSLLGVAEGAGLLRPPETAPPAPEVQSPV